MEVSLIRLSPVRGERFPEASNVKPRYFLAYPAISSHDIAVSTIGHGPIEKGAEIVEILEMSAQRTLQEEHDESEKRASFNANPFRNGLLYL